MTSYKKLKFLERYSRQIILKNIGFEGQGKLSRSRVFIVGAGGLGCPIADNLCRAGIGEIAIADNDKITLSNIHRQLFFDTTEIGKFKVDVVKKKIKKINSSIKIFIHKKNITKNNIDKFLKNYDLIVDASDNFKTKFLLNKYSLKHKKRLIIGAISKFDGHIFKFNFKNRLSPCLKCFYETIPSDEILNCEIDGVMGTTAMLIGAIQANEVIKSILNIGKKLDGSILIVNLLNLNFRISNYSKRTKCSCQK